MNEVHGFVFVLAFGYLDGSAFRVCGVTQNPVVAKAWRAASFTSEHKVYRIEIDTMRDADTGWEEWKQDDDG